MTAAALPSRRTGPLPGGVSGALIATSDGYRNIISVMMLITISRIHQHFGFLTPFRPALTLTMLAGLYALMNPRYLSGDFAPKTWSARMIAAIAIMACLSVPFGLSMGNSGSFIIKEFSKTILFAYLVLLAVRKSGDLYRLIWAMTAAGGALAWLSLFVFRMQKQGDTISRIQNGYSYDSNDLGLVAVLCLVLSTLTWQVAKSRGKVASLIVMGGLGAAIARTGSRGAFLTLVVVGGAVLVLLQGVSAAKKVAFVILTIIAMLLAAPAGYWEQMETILRPTQDYNWSSPTGRKEVFLRGMGYMMTNPVTGIGVDNFPRAEGEISARAEAREFDPTLPGIKWSAAHNSFLQAATEMGIPGFIIFSILVFGAPVQCHRLRKKMVGWDKGDDEQRFLYFTALYLPIAFIGFAVGGNFVSFAYLDPLYVLVAFVGGLHISYDERMRREARAGDGGGGPQVIAPETAGPRRHRGGLAQGQGRPPAALPPPVMYPRSSS